MSDNLITKDRRHIWHPFTQHQTEETPLVISRAKNATLYGPNGETYLDMISSWWTCLHGHAHPVLNKALCEQASQMNHVMFAGFTHKPAVDLAFSISNHLPGCLNRVFFSDNGSTAVEVALKIAFHYWRNLGQTKRTKFIAFEGAYHGDTFGAMSVGKGSHFFGPYEDLLVDILSIPFAPTWIDDEDIEQKEAAILSQFDELIATQGETCAAFIMEPLVQGAGGMRMCRPQFIKALTKKAQDAGILVIYDEVATGFGRTGSLFALEQCQTEPDLICLSKGLTGGTMPLSLTVASDHLFEGFLGEDFTRALAHGHSYTANPMACAIANASLTLFEKNARCQMTAITQAHTTFLTQIADHPKVKHRRQHGTIAAFDLNLEGDGYKSKASEQLRHNFLASGLNIRPLGQTIYLMPPYCITGDELKLAYTVILREIDRL